MVVQFIDSGLFRFVSKTERASSWEGVHCLLRGEALRAMDSRLRQLAYSRADIYEDGSAPVPGFGTRRRLAIAWRTGNRWKLTMADGTETAVPV